MEIQQLDLSNRSIALNLLNIQRAAYRVEANLIGSSDIPPLHETLEVLQQCNEVFYGAFVDVQLAGAVAYQIAGDTLDICRMMVHPDYFRRGIASALLTFLQELHPHILRSIVSTGSLNKPARALYQSYGFAEVGEKEVVPGLWISLFEKVMR